MQSDTYNDIIEKSKEKIRKDNSFIRRNYPVLVLAWVAYIIATVVSTGAVAAHVFIRLGETFNTVVAVIFTVLITGLVIVFQFMLKYFVDDCQAKAWRKGGSDRFMMLGKIIAGLVGLIAGAMLSINGADKAVDFVRKEKTETAVKAIDLAPIKTEFDSRIAALQAQRRTYEASTWKGKPTPQSLRGVKKIDEQIALINAERGAKVMQIDSVNTAMLSEYQAETATNSNAARGFMGIAECLIIPLCLILIGIFDDGVKREAKSIGVKLPDPF